MLVVARTLTATNRLLDVLPVISGDPRVQVVFTLDEGSAYAVGARRQLDELRVPFVPWSAAVRQRWDLVLSASADTGLAELDGPVLVLAHGAGHSRYLPRDPHRRQLAGLSAAQLVHDGRLVPALIGLSTEADRHRLAAAHPDAPARAEVVGDPCYDRIVASTRHRDRYRSALGVGAGQRLVVLSSTWGRRSLLGRYPTLPARVLGALPADRYRVALVAHPNVWIGHGDWQLRAWLDEATDAGLVLLPPTDGWQAALLAADLVVGDHGSTGLYAAGLDLPILLAAAGTDELVPGTPADRFGRTAPPLDARGGLRHQIETALTDYRPGAWDRLTADVFTARGRSLPLLRAACYRLLGLPEPATPPTARTVPAPDVRIRRPTTLRVLGTVDRDAVPTVTLHRFPAAVADPDDGVPGAQHLAVDEADASAYRFAAATVTVRTEPTDDVAGWLAETLARQPICQVAAVVSGRTCTVRHRNGAGSVLRARSTVADAAALASVGYLLGPEFRGRCRLRIGDTVTPVEVLRPPTTPAGRPATG